jgi:hypothetical protein
MIDKDLRAVESVASQRDGGVRSAKISTCRLVAQSRTIEKFLPAYARQRTTQAVLPANSSADYFIRKPTIERVKRRLAGDTFWPKEHALT